MTDPIDTIAVLEFDTGSGFYREYVMGNLATVTSFIYLVDCIARATFTMRLPG